METPGERNGAAEALDFIKIYMVVIWGSCWSHLSRSGVNETVAACFTCVSPPPEQPFSVAIGAQVFLLGAIFDLDGSTTTPQLRIYSYILGAADTTTADEHTTCGTG